MAALKALLVSFLCMGNMYGNEELERKIIADARGVNLDRLVTAVIKQESSFNSDAVSHAGAKGLMQLMDATGREMARELGFPERAYDPFSPSQNKTIGTAYLVKMLRQFGSVPLALAAYNAGPTRVSKLLQQHGDSWQAIALHLPQETQNYVATIMRRITGWENVA